MPNKSWAKRLIVSLWIVGAIVLMAMAITYEQISPVEKIALISIIFTAFFGPLAIARVNHRRAEQDSKN